MSRAVLVATLAAFLVAGALLARTISTSEPPPPLPYATDRVLLKLRPEADPNDVLMVRGQLSAEISHTFRSGAQEWRLPPNLSVASAIESLRGSEFVEYVEPDWYLHPNATFPADNLFPQQWSLYNPSGPDIDAHLAWDITTGIADPNQRPIIAIIDGGIDYTHPDLADNMWVNSLEASGDPDFDDDDNGYVDDIYGYDFEDLDGDPYADDMGAQKHGTHVAGIAGAVAAFEPESEGIAGINWKSRIMALKLWTSKRGLKDPTASTAAKAVDYARTMGADVINGSWSIDPACASPCARTLEAAIRDAGRSEILFVAAGVTRDGISIRVIPGSSTTRRRIHSIRWWA